MVTAYPAIQTLVFPLDPVQLPQRSWMQLYLPAAWRDAIAAAARRQAKNEKASPRYATLHSALRATLPQLIDINRDAWGKPNNYWLLAEVPLDVEAVTNAVHSWLRKEYARLDVLPDLLAEIEPQQLQWQPVTIQLNQGEPAQTDYRLVPHLVAYALSQEGVTARVGGLELHWHRVAAPEQGAEVLSWPPLTHATSKQGWYYSYVLVFTVQTLPEAAGAYLHMSVSVRRWASRKDVRLPGGDNTSVYLQAPESWLTGDGRRTFCVAPAGWVRLGPGKFQPDWKDSLPEIIAHLHHVRLPVLEEVAKDPAPYLGSGSAHIGIAFGNWKRQTHRVGTGANPADRKTLYKHVCAVLPWLKPVTLLNKVRSRKLQEQEETPERRLAALRAACGPQVRLEAWYQQEHVVRRLQAAAQKLLGADTDWVLQAYRLPDDFTAELKLQVETPSAAVVQEQSKERASQISTYLRDQAQSAQADGPCLAFVQIENQTGPTDAKNAIRSGFASTGRLTQCLFGKDDGLKEEALAAKYGNTCLDLFRQAGHLPQPPRALLGGSFAEIPAGLQLLAVWLIRRNRSGQGAPTCLPVAVRMRLDSTQVEAAAWGEDWRPYPDLLLRLVGKQDLRVPDSQVPEWLQRLVVDTSKTGPCLLLVGAQNLRRAWKWLGNRKMGADRLSFGAASFVPSSVPGLRVVRLRDHESHETPQWFAAAGDQAGITDGLFSPAPRLVYSIAEKAKSMRSNVKLTKAERPTNVSVMPSILELAFPFLQAGDEPLEWAHLVHLLRSAHPHFDDATVLPLPMHLAKQMEEYLVQVPSDNGSLFQL